MPVQKFLLLPLLLLLGCSQPQSSPRNTPPDDVAFKLFQEKDFGQDWIQAKNALRSLVDKQGGLGLIIAIETIDSTSAYFYQAHYGHSSMGWIASTHFKDIQTGELVKLCGYIKSGGFSIETSEVVRRKIKFPDDIKTLELSFSAACCGEKFFKLPLPAIGSKMTINCLHLPPKA